MAIPWHFGPESLADASRFVQVLDTSKSALWAIGVDRVLVCVEDPAPGPHHGEGSHIDELFRAQVATVQEGPLAKIHPSPIKNREMDRLQFAS